MADKREHPRGKVERATVTYDAGAEACEGAVRDVGRGGMFVMTETPLAAGKRITFDVKTTKGTISGAGRVVWVRASAEGGDVVERMDRPAGMGVRFIDVDDVSLGIIDALVAQAAEPPPKKPAGDARTVLGIAPPPAAAKPPPRKGTVLGMGVVVPPKKVDAPSQPEVPDEGWDAEEPKPAVASPAAPEASPAVAAPRPAAAPETAPAVAAAPEPAPEPAPAPAVAAAPEPETAPAPAPAVAAAPEPEPAQAAPEPAKPAPEPAKAAPKPATPRAPPAKEPRAATAVAAPEKKGGLGVWIALAILAIGGGVVYLMRGAIFGAQPPPPAPRATAVPDSASAPTAASTAVRASASATGSASVPASASSAPVPASASAAASALTAASASAQASAKPAASHRPPLHKPAAPKPTTTGDDPY